MLDPVMRKMQMMELRKAAILSGNEIRSEHQTAIDRTRDEPSIMEEGDVTLILLIDS